MIENKVDFIGMNLIKAKYSRITFNDPEYFKLYAEHIPSKSMNTVDAVKFKVELKFVGDEISVFEYMGLFKVNDENLRKDLEKSLFSIFVSVVFPFIRTSINQITDDTRGSIMLPIMDMRDADFSKGVQITYSKSNKK